MYVLCRLQTMEQFLSVVTRQQSKKEEFSSALFVQKKVRVFLVCGKKQYFTVLVIIVARSVNRRTRSIPKITRENGVASVFKSCWEIIKFDIVEAANAFHNLRTTSLPLINTANIVLLLKK